MIAESPLISSSQTGPLGVMHLPRLWLKILLHAAGRLGEGYRYGEGGFDEVMCERIGIDRDAFVAYVRTEKPDYLSLENWVRTHATNLTPEAIAAHNAAVVDASLGAEKAAQRCAELGLAESGFRNAILLNDLDDWAAAYKRLTAQS